MSREMKHSGIEWIGEIPNHWIMARLKDIKANKPYAIVDGPFGSAISTNDYKESGVPLVRIVNLIGKYLDNTSTVYISPEHAKLVSRSGFSLQDIIFAKTGATVGKCSINNSIEYGILASSCIKISISDDLDNRYYYFYFNTNQFNLALRLACGGSTRDTINLVPFKELPCIIPPLPEQQKIADYLDKVCSEVDELVSLQEKMIEELKAYKQSVITEAVTKGLNPNVPMLNSGIDWIGEIPEGWEVKRLKDLFLLQTGTTPKDYEKGLNTDVLVNWFTPSDVGEMNCELNVSQRHLSKKVIDGEGIRLYPKGSLIFVAIGASAGKIGYANIEGYSNQQITALIPKENCYSKYCYYYMIADRKRIRENAFFTTLPIINNGYLSDVKILLPPLSEQQAIASYLDTKCSEIDSLIALKQQKIEELKEYKKSFIYEYVTGKKEVV